MTPEEAIHELKIVKDDIGTYEINTPRCKVKRWPMITAKAFDMAYEALEYRIPKKVLYTFTNANSEKRIYGCPTCEQFIPHKGRKYCLNCGQALDWSEVEE